MFLKKIYKKVLQRKIALVNRELERIRFRDKDVQEMYGYSVLAGGKRFRPLLVMLACEAVGGKAKQAAPVAASFELLHKASLIHDDLIDEDEYRRGRKTFHVQFTKQKAVVMGDLLVAVAFDQLFRQRDFLADRFPACYQTFLDTFRQLSMGELKEEILRERTTLESSDIEALHYQKTAVLIESCFRIGAYCGDGREQEVAILADFGRNVGHIFQIINDINNIDGLESKVKHKLYSDIAGKRKNHMILHALKTAPQKVELCRILSKPSLSGRDVERVLFIVRSNGSVAYAYKEIDQYLWESRKALSGLRPSATKRILTKLLDEAKSTWFWQSK
jgi:geranylgeranyl diphosphate synthase, type I